MLNDNEVLINNSGIEIENAHIISRNFSGTARKFNPEGNRNFCVVIDDINIAQDLANKGWNVQIKPPREEGDDNFCYLRVKVSYKYPEKVPKITWITKNNKVDVTEDIVHDLDFINIKRADLIIRPYHWTVNGKSGTTAYLKKMWITQEESALEEKYATEEYPVE